MKTAEFKHHTIPVINQRTVNSTRDFNGYHLSYDPSAAGYGTDTTAIVIEQRVFFTLKGNHKQALSAAADIGGLSACIQYFIDNISQAHPYSEHRQATGLTADPFKLGPTVREAISPELFQALTDAS